MLSYLIWKRTFRATCWFQNQDPCPTDRYFMIIFWRPPGVFKWSSIFWPLTLQPLEVYWTTVQQIKGYIHSFHMRYISIPCPKRLQRYWFWNFLSESSLVSEVLLTAEPLHLSFTFIISYTWHATSTWSIGAHSSLLVLQLLEESLTSTEEASPARSDASWRNPSHILLYFIIFLGGGSHHFAPRLI